MRRILILIIALVVCMNMFACKKNTPEPFIEEQIQTTTASEATERAGSVEITAGTEPYETVEVAENKNLVEDERENISFERENTQVELEISDWDGREDELPIG